MTNRSFEVIGLSDLRNDPRYRDIDGQADQGPRLVIAVLDTGLDASHPQLDDNFVGYFDFIDDNTGRVITSDRVPGLITEASSTADNDGHGTHVSGTVGAESDQIGVARNVGLIGLSVLGNRARTETRDPLFEALKWVRDNNRGTINGQEYQIIGVNMSIQSADFTSPNQIPPNSPLGERTSVIRELESQGITVVSAAGNDYVNQAIQRLRNETDIPLQNVSFPAISSTLSIGSVGLNDKPSIFSQRLDFPQMLFATGENINSTLPSNRFGRLDGTSMASPHVAGAVALLQDAALTFGNRTLTTAEIQEILRDTAVPITDDVNLRLRDGTPISSTGEEYLRLNIYEAVQEVDRRLRGGTTPDPNPPTDGDSNGTINTAFVLSSLSDTYSDIIGTDGNNDVGGADVDIVQFELTQGGLVTITTSANDPQNQVDTILRVFDSTGNELAVDDDGGDGLYSSAEVLLGAGTYYAGVSSFNNINYNPNVVNSGSQGRTTGSYALGFEFVPQNNVVSGDRNGTIDTAFETNFVFDELARQIQVSTIGSDPIPNVADRASVGRTDVDILEFEVTTPGLMVIETSDFDTNDSENLDSYLRLFNDQGTQLAFDDDGGDGLFSSIEYNFDTPGTYYLGVSGFNNSRYNPNALEDRVDGSTGSVNVTFDFQPAGNTDPNGVINGAIDVVLTPGEVTGFFGEIGTDFGEIQVNDADVDLFRLTLERRTSLLIDTDTPFGPEFNNGTNDLTPTDTVLRFFDANGIEIGSSDDRFAEDITGEVIEFDSDSVGRNGSNAQDRFGNLIGHDLDSFLRVEVEPGTYYVGVSAFLNTSYEIDNLNNRNSNATGGFYQLLITDITTNDANGSIPQASPINISDSINGNIGLDNNQEVGSIDVDFYEITPDQRGLLQVDINAFSTSLPEAVDSVLFLFDDQGNQLAFNDDAFGSLDANIEYIVNGGETYYIAVGGYNNINFDPNIPGSGIAGDTGNYNLSVNLLRPQNQPPTPDLNPFAAALADIYQNSTTSQLDFDRNIVSQAFDSLDFANVNFLTLGETISSVLGEDPQENSATFSNLYGSASAAVFGETQTANNNGGLPEDADYYPLNITEPGRYDLRTLVLNTEVGSLGTRTNLSLYNADREEVEVINSGIDLPGVDSRLLVNITETGNYWLVVLPEGEAAQQFDFVQGTFGDVSSAQREELTSSLGEYNLLPSNFVLQAASDPSFSNGALNLQLNDVISVEELSLYDGADAETPESSVVAVDDNGNPVDGSLVVDNTTGEVTFVPTNPLSTANYTVTYRGDDFMTQDDTFASQRSLDGDGDGTAGGNLVSSFAVNNDEIMVSLPGFARGPGQTVDLGAAGTGLPISISNGEGLTDIRLRVEYNSQLLNITDAVLADQLPDGWSITGVDIANNRVVIDLAGDTPLSAGVTELVKVTAAVPETAPYNESQVLQISGGAINNDGNSVIFEETSAVHKLAFLGDTNADGVLDSGDAFDVLLQSVARSNTSGLDPFDLTDPDLITSTNGDFVTDAGDSFDVLLASVEQGIVPSIPGSARDNLDVTGPDPRVAIETVNATPGEEDVQVEVRLNNVEPEAVGQLLQGINLEIRFNTEFLSITDNNNLGDSPDVNFEFFTQAGGTVAETVVDDDGRISVAASLGLQSLFTLEATTDVLLGTITFDIANTAPEEAIVLDLLDTSSLIGRDPNNPAQRVDLTLTTEDGGVNIQSDPPPVVANPIDDITVDEDAENETIDLSNVFNDPNGDAISLAVQNNSNSDLVSTQIDGDDNLILDFLDNQFGTAEITVRATANGETVDDTFTVTVDPVDDPPIVINPIADITVEPNAENRIIDLSNVFEDIDSDIELQIVENNQPNDVVEPLLNQEDLTLTLDFRENQSGTENITVRATGDGQSVDNTFTVTVEPVLDVQINRFQNSNGPGTYLFAGEDESVSIRANFPEFIEEGLAFNVADEPGDNLILLNRFQNSNVPGGYLFATEEESVSIQENFSEFILEGPAFYVYEAGAGIGEEFIRFQNSNLSGTYLFAAEEEAQSIRANFPEFIEEGVAFEAVL